MNWVRSLEAFLFRERKDAGLPIMDITKWVRSLAWLGSGVRESLFLLKKKKPLGKKKNIIEKGLEKRSGESSNPNEQFDVRSTSAASCGEILSGPISVFLCKEKSLMQKETIEKILLKEVNCYER